MADRIIENLSVENFACFEEAEFNQFSKGINVFIGENGTGKTYILKALYAFSNHRNFLGSKNPDSEYIIFQYLAPYRGLDSRIDLLRDKHNTLLLNIQIDRNDASLRINPNGGMGLSIPNALQMAGIEHLLYLPTQEMLSWQRGFINIYSRQENGFDHTYFDLAVALNGEKLKSPYLEEAEAFIHEIKETIQADVYRENGRFYFKFYNEDLTLEAPAVATGINKLGQLMYLILNGSFTKDTVVFWDEPETNLNPRYISVVAKVLKTLAKVGCQLFIATHDYLLIHLLSLDAEYPEEGNPGIRFFSFYKTPNGTKIEEGDTLADLQHNVILDEYAALHEKELTLFQENLK